MQAKDDVDEEEYNFICYFSFSTQNSKQRSKEKIVWIVCLTEVLFCVCAVSTWIPATYCLVNATHFRQCDTCEMDFTELHHRWHQKTGRAYKCTLYMMHYSSSFIFLMKENSKLCYEQTASNDDDEEEKN